MWVLNEVPREQGPAKDSVRSSWSCWGAGHKRERTQAGWTEGQGAREMDSVLVKRRRKTADCCRESEKSCWKKENLFCVGGKSEPQRQGEGRDFRLAKAVCLSLLICNMGIIVLPSFLGL